MGELVIRSGASAGTVFVLPDEPVVVGRAPVCHIQLNDPWISSTHARLERRAGELWAVDLASSNGTWKDDVRVNEVKLAPGTVIRFGKTEVTYRDVRRAETIAAPVAAGARSGPSASAASTASTAAASANVLNQPGTLFRPLADLQQLTRASITPARQTLSGSEEDPGVAYRRQVGLLNEIGRALVNATDVDGALATILETVKRAVRAERAVLLVADERGAMLPRVSRPDGVAPWYSRTLIDAAVENRAGLISHDAQADARFGRAQSVIAQNIRSFLCAPIWADTRILGMLVMDRTIVEPFS